MKKIYVSSKISHAQMWKDLRSEGYNIISSWIDKDIDPKDFSSVMPELWEDFVNECTQSDFLLLYKKPNETLKGAFVEIGMALATGSQILCVGDLQDCGTFWYHKNVKRFNTLNDALEFIK